MTDDAHSPSLDDTPPLQEAVTLDFDDAVVDVRSELTSHTNSSMTPGGAGHIATRYEILGLLGSGGMGNVYKVRDIELDEIIALKTLHESLHENDQALLRFRREVKLARRVTHPNVARTYDLGTDADMLYLTMEWVEGETLSTHLHRVRRQQGGLEPGRAIAITCEIARGLAAAHQVGVIHRDLKPANVMITRDGRIVITDFGIARISSGSEAITGMNGMVGTPLYMSPEQVEGKSEIDARTDLYALGIICYEMLTNSPPFHGDNPVTLALARILKDPPTLSTATFPAALSRIVTRMLERDPALRYPDAQSLIEALEPLAQTLTSSTFMPSVRLAEEDLPPHRDAQRSGESTHSTVAIFPLSHGSGEQDNYLVDGFTEELIGELSMAPNLRVKPLSALKTLLAESEDHDPLRVGKRLGVDVVVTGSMREQGDQLRIRLSLLSVREGFQIWGEKFMTSSADLFITAERAAEALASALTSEVEDQRRPEPLTDPVAVDAYMRGRYLLQLKWFESVEEAIAMFRTAQQRVPGDPRILTGLATAMARQVFFTPAQAHLLLGQAREYATHAVTLAPKWPEPHYAMAMIAYADGDFSKTISACQRALALSSDHIDAHDLLGRVLAEVGPLSEASYHLEQALTLNDSLYRAWWDLVRVCALQERWEKVDELLRKSRGVLLHHNATQSFLFRIHCWRGRDLQSFKPDFKDDHVDVRFDVVFETIELLCEQGTLSEEYIHDLQMQARLIPSGSQHIRVFLQLTAEFALIAGHHELAYRAIESALNEGLRDLMWLQHLCVLDPLRKEERFMALLSRAQQMLSPVRATLTPHIH